MILTRTITKKLLETIVQETFSTFGNLSSSSLLDSLKFLGFYYATNAGISINIEDLKTPDMKKEFLKTAVDEMEYVSQQWQQGFVSDTERFQTIIDSWNVATESLKNRIVDYYQNFDPANNLYIMAFSGARGNMSQVRQLVGMRGLMSDQDGKIIDLPIRTNFREGLSSIDYIISSYGARKGIVDTALKTADSGYLTRRLIYIAQDLIIREIDCRTNQGILILLSNNTSSKNIIGRQILDIQSIKTKEVPLIFKGTFLNEIDFLKLKEHSPLILNIRSPLTCKSNGSICQNCYGWDLAQNKLISLGEAVGIIAAQSIGEPGTQLTMRTFHTGGIFTSELLKQILSPFSGKILIPSSLKTISFRTNHGIIVAKLQQEATITIINWKGIKKELFLEIGTFLYITKTCFIKKGDLIAEYSSQSSIPGGRRLKPVYTSLAGEIKFESLSIRTINREDKAKVKVNQDNGILWVTSGKIFPLPKEVNYNFPASLEKSKPFAKLVFVSPIQGIITFEEKTLIITNQKEKVSINLGNITKQIKNCTTKFNCLLKNYQYIDKYTTIGFLEFFSEYEGKIYAVKKRDTKTISTFFLITESDIWKINTDQVNNFNVFPKKKEIIRRGNLLNQTSAFSNSGIFLKKDGFKMIFQNALPIFLSKDTILNCSPGDFVFEKQILATLVNYTQQTEDIVQGLPKIEELIEARVPKLKAYLSTRPGIFLNSLLSQKLLTTEIKDNIISCHYERDEAELLKKTNVSKRKKLRVEIIHSIYIKEEIILYNDKLWKAIPIPPGFLPIYKKIKRECSFEKQLGRKEDKNSQILRVNGKVLSSSWVPLASKDADSFLYKYKNQKILPWKQINKKIDSIFENKKGDYIIRTTEEKYLFLENLNPILEYNLPLSTKLLAKPGIFIDIGEPITEGIIDPHELLNILFKYHSTLDGTMIGTLKSLTKFQLLLVNSVQAIYQSQGVNISSKHIEIIVRQMTDKVVMKESGDTPLLPGELIKLSLIGEIYKAFHSLQENKKYKTPKYEPLFLSTTNSSLSKDGFLSAAGFQETKRVLTKAAVEGNSDWLRGLKECVIIGRLIPAGSAFLNYKNYLDNIYLFKD